MKIFATKTLCPCGVMQNLLGGLIQVQLFMLQIRYRDFVRGGPCKEEKEKLK